MKTCLSIPVLPGAVMFVNSVMAAAAPAAKETQVLQRIHVQETDREMGMGIAEFPPQRRKTTPQGDWT
ncbi:hypothetical protein [Paraburkholderia sp. BL10I2N1]|uniref:hypothetical protein n=1 Tax=Paraburkholderia sp. BL10I2N1 TaxID=1938796 RepID=UPI001FB5933B|nr:hypothetical protein [Paraburkholderia sp. BL10I2N1]